MTDITNKLTTEEKEAYIQSVEKEIVTYNAGNIIFKGGAIVYGLGIIIMLLNPIVGAAIGLIGGASCMSSIIQDEKDKDKYTKQLKQTKKELNKLYK
ncbi:MAG: hypothetical protein ABIC91_05830 [Nanoarchaeota archaeon]|nr:hypothetical protein [Nanoarchaeota archaeon]MBU1030968.1 hypothetical protein [Nanoarchaeota archaeon]MBU1850167.1 hypothetical protein [Nanoarchaeota archaeon]